MSAARIIPMRRKGQKTGITVLFGLSPDHAKAVAAAMATLPAAPSTYVLEELHLTSPGLDCYHCEAQRTLVPRLQEIHKDGAWQRIIVVAAPDGDPRGIADGILSAFEEDEAFGKAMEIERFISVIDAPSFWAHLTTEIPVASSRLQDLPPQPAMTIDALTNQLEHTDLILLRGLDNIPAQTALEIRDGIALVQRRAPVYELKAEDEGGELAGALHLAPRYDEDFTAGGCSWRQAMDWFQYDNTAATLEGAATDLSGYSVFVYRRRRPFHPKRLDYFMAQWPTQVFRTMGQCWLASSRDEAWVLSQISEAPMAIYPDGPWVASLPPEEREAWFEENADMQSLWDGRWGDRFTELVFTGVNLDHAALKARLDGCLLTDSELETDWNAIENPFETPLPGAQKRSGWLSIIKGDGDGH